MSSVPDTDLERVKRYCAEKSPAKFADKIRIVFKTRGNSVTIVESNCWDSHGPDWFDVPVAQLRYSPETTKWSLYWSDRNSKWHPYDFIRPGSVASLLKEIDKDPTCIFWG